MSEEQDQATWNVAEWHGKMLVDCKASCRTSTLTSRLTSRRFAIVKEGFIDRHLTFVPLSRQQIGPEELQLEVSKEQVRSAPDIVDRPCRHADRPPVVTF